MNCYLSRNYKDLNGAGNKAKTDMEQIMVSMGFKNIGLKRTFYHNQVISFFLTLAGVIKAVCCLRKGDVLLLQYPLKKYFAFLCNAAHLKGCKVIILIHDLGSFRRKKLTIPQEIRRLNHADYAIVLNPSKPLPLPHSRTDILQGGVCRRTEPTKECIPVPVGELYQALRGFFVWHRT